MCLALEVEGDPDRLLRGDHCGGHGPRARKEGGEAEGMRRMVMSTAVSISAAPPIGSEIGLPLPTPTAESLTDGAGGSVRAAAWLPGWVSVHMFLRCV